MELFFPNTTAEWKKLIDYHDISWDEEQEQNLIYVAITRAKETLYEITVEE